MAAAKKIVKRGTNAKKSAKAPKGRAAAKRPSAKGKAKTAGAKTKRVVKS